jgi:hypothetical protein
LYRVHSGSLNGRAMRRMWLSIDYACESARRRRAGQAAISLADFQRERDARSLWQRGAERMHAYALRQYRLAVAEQCGGQPVWGSMRLAWAAACSPTLSVQRIARMLRHSTGRNGRPNATT